MTDDPFLGGNSLPSAKFAEIGDKVTGQIVAARQVVDRDLDGNTRRWPNGDERRVWVLDLDTDADQRADLTVWVRGHLHTALREALREAGVGTIGAMVSITHHGLGEPKTKGFKPPKLFTVRAKAGPPLQPQTPAGIDDEDPF